MITEQKMLALRMQRQRLVPQEEGKGYDALFRDFSPVPGIGWMEPGSPPSMPPHASFDDGEYNARRRAGRNILKGRFGGRVAYVAAEDWELFACLYRKPIARLSYEQNKMMELLYQEGPLTIGLVKELTGLLVKQITPILHRLQEAFLVYEDQVDNGGDRGWYVLEREFPEIDLERYTKVEALTLVLRRFAYRHVFFTAFMAKNFYQQPEKTVRQAIDILLGEGVLKEVCLEGEMGYIRPEDAVMLSGDTIEPLPPFSLLLERTDFLVKSLLPQWTERPPETGEILYYLLIDGKIQGAVCGKFKFGPPVLQDVWLELPEQEREVRQMEILNAVYQVCDRKESPLRRYCGRDVIDGAQ